MKIFSFFQWLKGYVKVICSGDNSSAFINFLLRQHIRIWDICKNGSCTEFKMFIKDYKKILSLRHKFNSVINISHSGVFGLPRKIGKLLKRKSVFVGFAFFIAIIIFFSSFIWKIEIVGNDTIENAKIANAYTELGVRIGMPKRKLDSYSLRDRLPLMIRDISWCSFNLEGSKLTVNVTEISEMDKSNKNSYSNLVATTDGRIKKVDIISGNKMISVGDVVRKGEVLVSGAPELNSQQFTFSSGEIIAETKRNVSIEISKFGKYYVRTGRQTEKSIINIFGFKIPMYLDSVHYKYIADKSSKQLTLLNATLPIEIISKEFYEIKEIDKVVDSDEAYNEAKAKLVIDMKDLKVKEFEIQNYSVQCDDEKYLFSFECKCIENIAETKKIIVAS